MATAITQKKMMAGKGFITVWDAAQTTGQNYSTIYRYMTEKKLERLKVGNRWYVKVAALAKIYRGQDKNSPYIRLLADKLEELQEVKVAA
jgi:hypothetical protein